MNGWLLKQPDEYMVLQNDINYLIANTKKIIHPDEFNNAGFYTPQRLIAARLANNPQYDRLLKFCEAYKSFGANDKARATEWPKLVQYLEEAINPNTFWQQHALLKEELIRLEEDRIQQLITQFKLNPEQEVIPVSDQWYDAKTNLIWQRCCMGEHWQDGHKSGTAERLSWDEKNAYLERFKDTGWRLPTRVELEELVLSRRVGYITKNGFGFYEATEVRFCNWIEPHKSYSGQDICILSTSPSGASAKFRDDPNLVGYLRLVKSVS
ncbi:MAG: DUF1566 domain-containing protein [Moraxellaceae bacterium]|nr:DUF1566 domain-containing protein [Moraxellaceae bacterium]